MIAIRQIQAIQAGTITVHLPLDFPAKQVEIIILPVEEANSEPLNLQAFLLTAPTLSEEELQAFDTVRDWMDQWNVNEF